MAPTAGPTIPVVDEARCSGCGRCVASCPRRLFTLEAAGRRKVARLVIDSACDLCRRCVSACPLTVISLTPKIA